MQEKESLLLCALVWAPLALVLVPQGYLGPAHSSKLAYPHYMIPEAAVTGLAQQLLHLKACCKAMQQSWHITMT